MSAIRMKRDLGYVIRQSEHFIKMIDAAWAGINDVDKPDYIVAELKSVNQNLVFYRQLQQDGITVI